MADRIRFAVSAVPIETITDENGVAHDILASEVLHSLNGNGDSVPLTDYSGAVANQGYENGAVGYKNALHTAGGNALTNTTPSDFIFIKNTGFKYSDAVTLGISTTDCVMVAIKQNGYEAGNYGGYATDVGAGQPHYFEIAWLKPGQAIIIPGSAGYLNINQFGDNSADLIPLNSLTLDYGGSAIYVKTVQSNGVTATSANAIEFLAVT